MNVMLVQNTLTVVAFGQVYANLKVTDPEQAQQQMGYLYDEHINGTLTKDQLEQVLSELSPEYMSRIMEAKKLQKMRSYFDLPDNGYQVDHDGNIRISGIPINLPKSLATRLYEGRDNDRLVKALKNFWAWCVMNPDPQARKDLFDFLLKYGFSITDEGYFVAYRGVNRKVGDDIFPKGLVSKAYEIKREVDNGEMDAGTLNVRIVEHNQGYELMYNVPGMSLSQNYWGTAQEVIDHVESNMVFTDAHTGQMEIKMGEQVSIDRSACDPDPKVTCSRGLHVAGAEWLRQHNHFGEYRMIVIVNPKDVVAVPHADGYGKMRTCAYTPVSILDDELQFDYDDLHTYSHEANRDAFKEVMDAETVDNHPDVETSIQAIQVMNRDRDWFAQDRDEEWKRLQAQHIQHQAMEEGVDFDIDEEDEEEYGPEDGPHNVHDDSF